MKSFVLPLMIMLLPLLSNAQTVLSYNDADGAVRSLVFNPGDFNSKYYRIPAVVTLPDGTLVAVADKRIESLGDLPGVIDVVARRSTDGGRTWGPYITVVAHDADGGYGDPALVYDRKTGDLLVICTHGNGLWQKTPGQITVIRSSDGGLTWGKPVSINDQILTSDPSEKGKILANSAFASSGRALQTRSGRILFSLVTRQEGVDKFPVYAIYSDDSGRTWKASRTPATLDGDESKIVELPDGRLLMSIRNRWSGNRRVSLSTDKGRTWTEAPDFNLHDVACNGDILSVNYGGQNYLIQSLPAGPWRDNITLYASADGGKTWPYSYRVSNCPGAYSTMTLLPDNPLSSAQPHLVVLTEEAVHDAGPRHAGGYRIFSTNLPLSQLLPSELK